MTFCAKHQRLAQIAIQWGEGLFYESCRTQVSDTSIEVHLEEVIPNIDGRQFYVVGQELQRLEAILTSYMQHLLDGNLNWSHKLNGSRLLISIHDLSPETA